MQLNYVIVRKCSREVLPVHRSRYEVGGAEPAMERSRVLKSREDWEELLQGIDTILFDCDGQ